MLGFFRVSTPPLRPVPTLSHPRAVSVASSRWHFLATFDLNARAYSSIRLVENEKTQAHTGCRATPPEFRRSMTMAFILDEWAAGRKSHNDVEPVAFFLARVPRGGRLFVALCDAVLHAVCLTSDVPASCVVLRHRGERE